LGVKIENIKIVEGDTAAVPVGTGTFGSRSIAVGGSALFKAAEKVIEKGKKIAAHMLEASASDIEFAAGEFRVAGTDRKLSFGEVARAAYVPHRYPLEALEPGLDENAFYDPANFAFSNGAHVCEVEVDRETGTVEIVSYCAVDDVGTVINPMIVEGQIHGGLAQGIGQALAERTAYEEGQLLSASFMDYAIPRATDLPNFACETDGSQPCTHNPLGAKGCGESGAIGAPAAVISALLDALARLGVTDLEMPATPHRVWQAIMRK
jgi:carbon-monoxide dehydrogenase large subunit